MKPGDLHPVPTLNRQPNRRPWALSFSFGRALQGSALEAWQRGELSEAQARLVARARANALAQQGKPAEKEGEGEDGRSAPLWEAKTAPLGG